MRDQIEQKDKWRANSSLTTKTYLHLPHIMVLGPGNSIQILTTATTPAVNQIQTDFQQRLA